MARLNPAASTVRFSSSVRLSVVASARPVSMVRVTMPVGTETSTPASKLTPPGGKTWAGWKLDSEEAQAAKRLTAAAKKRTGADALFARGEKKAVPADAVKPAVAAL
jgi:hypothetical protein